MRGRPDRTPQGSSHQQLEQHLTLATRHGLDPCQMAIAFCRSRPFRTIPIIGATTLGQLRTNIGAAGLVLAPDVLADIAETHRSYPAPY